MATGIQHNSVSSHLHLLSKQPHSLDSCCQGPRSLPIPGFPRPSQIAHPLLRRSHSHATPHSLRLHGQLPCNRSAPLCSPITDISLLSSQHKLSSQQRGRATRAGRNRHVCAAAGASEAGPSGQGGANAGATRGGRGAASFGGPVLGAFDTVLRAVLVKILLVLHRVLSLALAVLRALWRGWPVRTVRNQVSPVIYGEGPLTTPWFLKPVELALRIVLFLVPGFVKRRVGPVAHAIVRMVGERSLSLVRKGAKQGLGGVREWGAETARMSEDGAPEARRVVVQIVYRLLQFYAFTVFMENLPGLTETAFYALGFLPKGVATLWRWSWAVIDYTLLDMDWVQPLQRLIVEVIWPFWRDYWILAAVCTVVWERLHPTLLTEADIYGEPIWVDE